ncbi:hypothetical protein C7293_09410 [filamentous cyanobacterium CCT1]|nr:hypothetical protein C7293_09410 [filamentous cyanobacterium CCT1]PSN81489.1 hypothetical protein C8B47_00950 [filamentous cyanobacterium CCP4]
MPIDVLIVGAGPTGLLLASVLARYGVSLRLIDKRPHPSQTSKALSVFARTLEIFEQLGIAEAAIARGIPIAKIQLYAGGDALAQLSFQSIDAHYPFVLSLPQSETEHLLESTLEPLGVQVERSVAFTELTQTDEGIVATLRHGDDQEETCEAKWLIGCDGAGSTVRDVTGLTRPGTSLNATFDLADVQLDWDLAPDCFRVFYGDDGVAGVIPLPQNHWRLIVTVPPEAEPREEPDLDWVERAVQGRSRRPVHLSNPIWSSRFSIRQRMVDSVRQGRVLLAGDALSSHSPLGGQGMNTGLQDAYNLGWKLALVVQNQAHSTLLDTYGVERLPVSRALLTTTAWGTRFMMMQNPVLQPIRRVVMGLALRADWVEHRLVSTLSELTVHYRNSPIGQEGGGTFSQLQVGDRAPDVRLQQGNHPIRLVQVLSPQQFTLLLFTAETSAAEDLARLFQLARDGAAQFPGWVTGQVIQLGNVKAERASDQPPILLDVDGEAHRRYGVQQPSLYLIRPDGYIGYRCQSIAIETLKTYLTQVVGLTDRSQYGSRPRSLG